MNQQHMRLRNPKKEMGVLKINTDTTDMINMMLLIKDKFQISDCGFRKLSAICKEIHSISAITKRMNGININLKVIEPPGGNGVQIESFEDSLRNNLFM